MKEVFYILGLFIAVSFLYIMNQESETVKDVKLGKLDLFCHMADGYRKINPDDVVGFDDRWIFKNGSASNCDVVEK